MSPLLSDARILAGYLIFFGSWLVLAMASTLAGNLTITGSVANIIVVERAAAEGVHVTYRDYMRVGLPLTAATIVAGSLWLWLTA